MEKGFGKKLLGTSLALLLALSSFSYRNLKAEEANSTTNDGITVTWEKVDVDADTVNKLRENAAGNIGNEQPALKGNVRVSIVLDKASTLDKGYPTANIANNAEAQSYRKTLANDQDAVAAAISKDVLDGEKLDVVWNITLAANIISANVPAEKIEEIKAIDGVKDVVVETQYEPAVADSSDNPNVAVSSTMTASQYAWAQGYTGAGSKVAIVDTGLDIEHQSFSPMAFDLSIMQLENKTGKKYDLLTADEVAAVWSQLNASQRTRSDAASTYFNTKVPYGFNYVDRNDDIIHINDRQGEHGSHVAGIAAANKFIYTESEDGSFSLQNAITAVGTEGNAPDAQLLVMKVFGTGGGAYDSDYFVAIEDAITLGADAVNLSLGSSVAGYVNNSTYADIINNTILSDIVWCNSAGNNSYWAENAGVGYLYGDDANFATGGSPATYRSTISVASVDNDGAIGTPMIFGEDSIFYTETSGYGNPALTTIPGEYEFIYVNAPGTPEDFAPVADLMAGKIAICNRGSTSFFEKANAAVANGAAAVIIANNQAGTISMNLSGYTGNVPVVSITQADGALLRDGTEVTLEDGTVYYTGTLTIQDKVSVSVYGSDYYNMSSFSSWGVPGDLSLKPEITTPGGNIYSVFGYSRSTAGAIQGGHDTYELMSGTSMAAPQLTGIVALVKQYLRETGKDAIADELGITVRALVHSLLMSTATPLVEEDSGYYWSVMKQGAGLANVDAFMNSKTVILMNNTEVDGENRKDMLLNQYDGKVKAELGDDPERAGKYAVEFYLNNVSDADLYYDLAAEFFTQDRFEYDGVEYLDTWMFPLEAALTWYVDGEKINNGAVYNFDEDEEGVFDANDAKALLDFVVGTRETIGDADKADLDEDGAVTTYDAYLALKYANEGMVNVPAKDSKLIRVEVELLNIADYDNNGAYVEGYIFATEAESEDGAFGVEHSIPVLGYYGSWSEPSMYDKGSYLEYTQGTETRDPYMASSSLGENAKNVKSFTLNYEGESGNYYFGGNPFDAEEVYKPERNALSSTSTIANARYSLIRNSSGSRFFITDEEGNLVDGTEKFGASAYAAYWVPSSAAWSNTSTSTSIGYKATAPEGTRLNLNLQLAPEYYVKEDGSIAWDEMADGTLYTMPFVVDNTAPTISQIIGARTDNGVILALEAEDNEYIAMLLVQDEDGNEVYTQGSTTEDKKNPTDADEETYAVDLDAETPDHLLVLLADYAGNVTGYQLNLNKEELKESATIEMDTPEVITVENGQVQLSATVGPWGQDQTVTWSSADESIATVDANGIVTGVSVGDVEIKAVPKADSSLSATAVVHVIKVEKKLNGMLWDEEGQEFFVEFNTASLPEYTKLTDKVTGDINGISYNADGSVLYAASITNDGASQLFTVDPATFALTAVADESEVGFFDLAAATLKDELFGVYGPYVLGVDTTTGTYDPDMVLDLSSDTHGEYFVGIAYEGSEVQNIYGRAPTDYFYVVDDAGYLYELTMVDLTNTLYGQYFGYGIEIWDFVEITQIGEPIDVDHYNSLYFDGENVFWSRFNNAENDVDMIALYNDTTYNTGYHAFDLGSFAEGVWPVAGLFELQAPAAKTDFPAINLDAEGVTAETLPALKFADAKVDEIKKIDFNNDRKGALNTAVTPEVDNEGEEPVEEDTTYTVELKATEELAHNGLYEVTFDPEAVEFVELTAVAPFNSSKTEDGKVVFGFADLDGFAKDEVVATLTFNVLTEEETVINAATEENEQNFEETVEEYVINKAEAVAPTIEVANSGKGVVVTWEAEEGTAYEVFRKQADGEYAKVGDAEEGTFTDGTAVAGEEYTYQVKAGELESNEETIVFNPFNDVETAPTKTAFKAIMWAYNEGIVKGTSEDTFSPAENVTRGQFAVMVWRLAGKPAIDATDNPFPDVSADALGNTTYKAILWAYQQGIVKGFSDGEFKPGETTSRGNMAVMLWRLAGKPAVDTSANPFEDVAPEMGNTTYKAILWAYNNGITKGTDATHFSPDNNCTREQLAIFLYRYNNLNN